MVNHGLEEIADGLLRGKLSCVVTAVSLDFEWLLAWRRSLFAISGVQLHDTSHASHLGWQLMLVS